MPTGEPATHRPAAARNDRRPRTQAAGRAAQHGAAMLAALLAIALLALAATQSLETGSAFSRRDAEAQLIADGLAFQAALRSWAQLPPQGPAPPGARGPMRLEDLLRDPRVPGVRRHLRRIPPDPLTGRAEWALVRDEQGHITGIHSLAPGQPVRRKGFPPGLAGFEDAASYRDWVFGLQPGRAGGETSKGTKRPGTDLGPSGTIG